MIIKIIVLSLLLLNFVGCQPSPVSSSKPMSSIEKKEYIGKHYQVMLDDVFMDLRNDLYEGQILTIKNVKKSKYGFIKILVNDQNGRQIFTKYYSFRDLGLLNEKEKPLYLKINKQKIKSGILGRQEHGYGLHGHKNYAFVSFVSKTRIDGILAYGYYDGLSGIGAQCVDSEVVLTYKDFQIIAAPNTKVSFSIYIDDGNVHHEVGNMFKDSYKSFYSKLSKKTEVDLLNGKRGAMKISTLSKTFIHIFYLDGFAEMYTRVRNNCY